jgi:nucleoside-diphosphate-sugar epimerase
VTSFPNSKLQNQLVKSIVYLMDPQIKSRKYLVTGASGYVGGRLVRSLLNEDLEVRVLVRDKEKIKGQPWFNHVEIVEGNAHSHRLLFVALNQSGQEF